MDRLARETSTSREQITTLLARYGTRAKEVARYQAADTDEALTHHLGYTHREIAFIVQYERVNHLDDLVLRRTAIALLGELNPDLLLELALLCATLLGWSETRVEDEMQRTCGILRNKHGIELHRGSIPATDEGKS